MRDVFACVFWYASIVCVYVCLYGTLFVCVSGVHTYTPYKNTHIYVMRIMISVSEMSFIRVRGRFL